MDGARPALARALLLALATAACGSRTELEPARAETASDGGRFANGGKAATGRMTGGVGGANGQGGMLASAASGGDGGQAPMQALAPPDAQRTPPTFCNVEGWCGASANYVAIWGTSAFDIWVVANYTGALDISDGMGDSTRSALLHWDGISWNATQLATRLLRGISGSAKNDVWVVGDSDFIEHYDGTTWTRTLAPVTAPVDFLAVSVLGPNEAWAVGYDTVLRYDGTDWRLPPEFRADVFRSVWSAAHAVWISGTNEIVRFDSGNWTDVPLMDGRAITSVWGRPNGGAWVAGRDGLLASWAEGAWKLEQVANQSVTTSYHGLWGNSDDDVWAVGEKGAIAHFDGKSWSSGPQLTDATLNAAWGTGTTTWVVGDNGTFLQLEDGRASASPLAQQRVSRLWSANANDVWAIGDDALHWDGKSWTQVVRPQGGSALGIWGSSSSDIWVACAQGKLLHWNGTSWSSSQQPSSDDINGVWGSSASDVWAVDEAGRFLHFDGKQWTNRPAPQPAPGALRAIAGRNAADIVALGIGQRYHFDGAQWSLSLPHPSETPTYRVAFGDGSRVWFGGQVGWSAYKAGGAYPELGRWTGVGFEDNLEPTGKDMLSLNLGMSSVGAIWASREEDAWIALPQAVHWDGKRWRQSPTPGESPALRALWGTSLELWAITESGQILRKSAVIGL